jgi:hypothetical protein
MRLTDWTKRRIFRTPRRSVLAFEIADLPATAYRAWRKLFVPFALMPVQRGKQLCALWQLFLIFKGKVIEEFS